MEGKLIVITGIDGSGKTVQTDLLVKRMALNGHDAEQIDFPQYGKTFFADMVARYLSGEFSGAVNAGSVSDDPQPVIGAPQSVDPYLTALLYAGDRWECREKITEWLNKGKVVIANRYVCCNMAYQGAKIADQGKRSEFCDWVNRLEYNLYKMPEPNITIFLRNAIEITRDLISRRSPREYHLPDDKSSACAGALAATDEVRDIHEDDADYMRHVQDMYLGLAASHENWKTIECVKDGKLLPEEQIADYVWGVVNGV